MKGHGLQFSTHKFKHRDRYVLFTVYRGQPCPQAGEGALGDVFFREPEGSEQSGEVFVKTSKGWEVYLMNPTNPHRNMRHPENNERVLVIEDGRFSWKALGSLRSRKKRAADKARNTEGSCEHMLFFTPSNPFNHTVFGQLTRPERFRVFVTTKLPVPIFLRLFLHAQHHFMNHRVRQCVARVECAYPPTNQVQTFQPPMSG